MSLFFIDSFDHWTGKVYAFNKWTYIGRIYADISTSIKRTGTGSARIWYDYLEVKKEFANKNTVVAGFAFYKTFNTTTKNIIQFLDGTTNQISIRFEANGVLSVYRGGTTLLGSSSAVNHFTNQWNYYEFKVVFNNTTGSVVIRRDEVEILSLTGIDTCSTANERCNAFGFYGLDNYYIDDLYLDDADFLGDIKVEAILPNGAGATTSWTPSAGANYACVDEAAANSDTDYVSSSTADQIDTYSYTNLATTNGTVFGVQVNMITRMDDSGANEVAPVVRPGTINHIGTSYAPTQLYTNPTEMFLTNPDTTQAWTIAQVNASEFGIKLIK